MRVRRLLFFAITALLASVMITGLLAPVDQTGRRAQPPDPGGGQAAAPAPEARAGQGDGVRVISAEETNQRVRLSVGEALRLQVESDEPLALALGEHGPVEYASPGAPAEFALFGRRGLDEPLTVLGSDVVVARVTAGERR